MSKLFQSTNISVTANENSIGNQACFASSWWVSGSQVTGIQPVE
jgi:hypothetical protein